MIIYRDTDKIMHEVVIEMDWGPEYYMKCSKWPKGPQLRPDEIVHETRHAVTCLLCLGLKT